MSSKVNTESTNSFIFMDIVELKDIGKVELIPTILSFHDTWLSICRETKGFREVNSLDISDISKIEYNPRKCMIKLYGRVRHHILSRDTKLPSTHSELTSIAITITRNAKPNIAYYKAIKARLGD